MLLGHFYSLEYPEIETVYDRFLSLQSLSLESSAHLLLHSGLDGEGVALCLAANVSGISSLCVEPEPALAKQAIRAGICEFMASDLEEALRILKNESRKGRAVSIALIGEPEMAVCEIIERELQLDIIHLFRDGRDVPGAQALIAQGARRLVMKQSSEDMIAVNWSVAREPLRWLPLADALALQSLDPRERSTPVRRRWIECSPNHLGRQFMAQRFSPMMPSEAEAFFNAVQRHVEGGEIQVAVSVVRNGEEELVLS